MRTGECCYFFKNEVNVVICLKTRTGECSHLFKNEVRLLDKRGHSQNFLLTVRSSEFWRAGLWDSLLSAPCLSIFFLTKTYRNTLRVESLKISQKSSPVVLWCAFFFKTMTFEKFDSPPFSSITWCTSLETQIPQYLAVQLQIEILVNSNLYRGI